MQGNRHTSNRWVWGRAAAIAVAVNLILGTARPAEAVTEAMLPPAHLGVMHFNYGSAGTLLLGDGWSRPENWGIWSDGKEAFLYIRRMGPTLGPLQLRFQVEGFAPTSNTEQSVMVLHNNQIIARWQLPDRRAVTSVIAIPAATEPSVWELKFVVSNPTSPRARNLGGDSRLLGIGVQSVEIAPGKP